MNNNMKIDKQKEATNQKSDKNPISNAKTVSRITQKNYNTAVNHEKNTTAPNFSTRGEINTDPFGSWTGVSTDDPYEKPIQDADDL